MKKDIDQLDCDSLIRLIIESFRRIVIHYGLWFKESEHQTDLDTALKLESEVWGKYFPLQMKRLAKVAGFEIEDGVPLALKRKSREELLKLLEAVSANWLACDGVWFQTVESRCDMFTAKRCNDTCWSRFSPFEAHRIKSLCQLPQHGGLDALKQALDFRLYARINEQSFDRPEKNTLIFRMNRCRVQYARQRKGLADYPCKSGGLVEYTTFARTIDSKIETECIACPPDEHPKQWFCSWKFTIPKQA